MTSMVSYGAHSLYVRNTKEIIKLQYSRVSVVVGESRGSVEAYKMGTKLGFG